MVRSTAVQSFSSPSEKGSFRGSRRGPLFLDLKSANLGITFLPLCLIRRLPEALSFEDMLSFVLLCTEGCEECVLPLCRLESIYLSDAVAGSDWINSRIFYNLLVCSEWTLDGMIAGAGTPNRLRLSRPLILFGISSAPEIFLDL
ncbi:hypothetical protein YC2023_103389 [Brassica napus]